MGFIKEYRIPMPFTLQEYQIAQLYMTAEMSKQETTADGSAGGVEICINEPFIDHPVLGSGQYTQKIYHIANKVPKFIAKCAPAKAMKLKEEAWNSYPNCKTILTNEWMGNKFNLMIQTVHLQDDGSTENIHGLDAKTLKNREVIYVDIVNDKLDSHHSDLDPTKITGSKALTTDWRKVKRADITYPMMCCYKLVTFKCEIPLLQSTIESFFENYQRNMFLNFNRQVFCTQEKWVNLTMDDIRQIEEKAKEELNQRIRISTQND